MLVLTRKVNETIQLGDDVTITIVRASDGKVRVGIDAPRHLAVTRDDAKVKVKRGHLAEAAA